MSVVGFLHRYASKAFSARIWETKERLCCFFPWLRKEKNKEIIKYFPRMREEERGEEEEREEEREREREAEIKMGKNNF